MSVGSVKVVSKRGHGVKPATGDVVIAIDRSNPVLGNRHYLKNIHDDIERQAVIDANARDLEADEVRNGPMTQQLKKIGERVAQGEHIALQCWCAPDACHGYTYAKRIRLYAGITA